ncbi:hypothetical protein GGE65_005284 [Skermanella aerolata]
MPNLHNSSIPLSLYRVNCRVQHSDIGMMYTIMYTKHFCDQFSGQNLTKR